MKIFYSPKCLDYEQPGHPESPERIRAVAARLASLGLTLEEPEPCSKDDLLRIHSPEMVDAVQACSFVDPDTPALPGMFIHGLRAAGSAVCAMQNAVSGTPTFSLMRPPGHHATRTRVMGFCYFNSIALAAVKFMDENPGRKIAVLDIDVHHGNGTEDILFGMNRALYVSLHQAPLYPGTGLESRGNCLNHPLPPSTEETRYLETLRMACDEILAFGPDMVAVSAGFDTYAKDPLAQMRLEISTYKKIGRMIDGLGKPCFFVMEGGYSENLPLCVEAFIGGLTETERTVVPARP
jgi:acetoin utilization deacetylase AcuC-like enzyme